MTIRTALKEGQSILFYAEVDTPALDAALLLAAALGWSKERLLSSLPDPLAEPELARFRSYLDQRCAGQPVSYIRRKKEFYSLEFYVDPRVLVPRPDTETLVEQALALLRPRGAGLKLHDACTGSGCVAVTLAHELPDLEVSASDISARAEEVFRMNARALLGGELAFIRSDLLESVPGRFDMITANPPYLSEREVGEMRKIGWPEPELALNGGEDGLDLARRLLRQAPSRLKPGGWLLLEAAPQQMEPLAAEARESGFSEIRVHPDLAGRPRVLAAGGPA
jgi:release factor glutamine methyltransferase